MGMNRILVVICCIIFPKILFGQTADNIADCNEMIDCVKTMFCENYGDSLALDQFLNHYHFFSGNYSPVVPRQRVLDLHSKMLTRTWNSFIHGYTPDYVPQVKGIPAEYMNLAYQGRFVALTVFVENEQSYLQTLMKHSQSPFVHRVYEQSLVSGVINAYYMNPEQLQENNMCELFRSGDRDVQLLVSVIMWHLMCYYANVDVYLGISKDLVTEEMIETTVHYDERE